MAENGVYVFRTLRDRDRLVVAGQISNIHAAAFESQGATCAQRVVTDGFLDWLIPQLVWDDNPEASARELCREILERTAAARRAIAAGGLK